MALNADMRITSQAPACGRSIGQIVPNTILEYPEFGRQLQTMTFLLEPVAYNQRKVIRRELYKAFMTSSPTGGFQPSGPSWTHSASHVPYDHSIGSFRHIKTRMYDKYLVVHSLRPPQKPKPKP